MSASSIATAYQAATWRDLNRGITLSRHVCERRCEDVSIHANKERLARWIYRMYHSEVLVDRETQYRAAPEKG
jgi:hypothetical protein